jgi:histidinol-phosphatase
MDYQADLDHALQLADAADEITKKYYRSGSLNIQTKPDKTPVTEGDLAVEKRLREIVTTEFNENYLGEEGARDGDATGRLWVVDPIDGTKNFMRGMPIWGTLIALSDNGETVAACVSAPALGRRWWAAKGLGAWTQDVDGTQRPIHVSGVSSIADSFLLISSPLHAWDKTSSSEEAVQTLLDAAWRWRAPGDMVNYMWVAEGAADACMEPYAKLWDIEAPKLIVTEAGGTFWTSADADTPPEAERAILATNGPLESPIKEALRLP